MQQALEVSDVFLDNLRFIPSMYTSRLNKPAANGILNCEKKTNNIEFHFFFWFLTLNR